MKKNLLFISILSFWAFSIQGQTPGNSLHFDGTNDYVTASLPSVFVSPASNDFTVEAWIKPQGSAFARVLFAQASTTSFFSLTLSASRQVYFYMNNTVGLVSSTSLTLGQWSHVACTWKASTSEAKIYINGALQTATSGGSSSIGTSNIMAIGSRTDGNQYFNGELDELRIWNVARNQCEITLSMNAEYTVAQTNLVACYKFNQGVAGGTNTTVTTLNDLTTSYNGTLINFALSGTSSNWLASAAVINQANPSTSFYSTDVITACDSVTWIDGITYTASNNTATKTLTSVFGCDSIIALDLTIHYSAASTDTHTACDSFVWINGITYTSSNNTATHTLSTVDGCDSVITLNLTINTVDVSVTVADPVITANETGATYQWLDCNNSYAIITGKTSQVFTATANGSYAVKVTKNGCTDTSMCVTIVTAGLDDHQVLNDVSVFPNPNQGIVNIHLGSMKDASVRIFNMHGRLMYAATNINDSVHKFEFHEVPGVYIIEVSAQGRRQYHRMVLSLY
ncbi:MAG TPA: T9SS type A sorting domain-containing protein [Bacteroidales bacterium]|nr:T9SS type A sorting domain-containing protein [Bacteroidales bacterium]HRZ50060.1 T9SS type A sorting domain-containing protein [Bacteroidales bacterium]